MEGIQFKISQYKKLEVKFEDILKCLFENGIRLLNEIEKADLDLIF